MKPKKMFFKNLLILFALAIFTASCSGGNNGGNSNNNSDSGTNTVTEAISIPIGFTILAARSTTAISLSWPSLSTITGAATYALFKNGTKLKDLSANEQSYVDSGLTINTEYAYFIKASNPSTSESTNIFRFNTLISADTEAPTTPSSLTAVPTFNSITLSWMGATDNIGIASYEIYKDTVLLSATNVSTLTYVDSGLSYNSSFSYTVLAVDGSGNKSPLTPPLVVQTLLDSQSPTTPNGLTGIAQATEIALHWNNSTDNHLVSGYKVFRDNVEVATVSGSFYLDTGLTKSQSYNYKVVAFDFASNQSAPSAVYTISTTNSNLRFKAFPSQVNLNWTDSVNFVPVTYKVHRDSGAGFQVIATTQLMGYQDTALTQNTNYTYKITYGVANTPLPLSQTTVQTPIRKIKLQVYEKSGNTVAVFPVQAFIPLPYGIYGQTEAQLKDTFILKDPNGLPVEAQYWVRSRWYAKDNSIKEMVVVFKAKNIPANAGRGQSGDPLAVEYTLEHGVTSQPANPVTVNETVNDITISNTNVSFKINKNNFNFIDYASFKGTPIINNTIADGGYLINLFNQHYSESQPCTTKAPTIYSVEEAGPVRARIRVERPAHMITNNADGCFTTFGSTLKEPVPGFVVWFDLYYDSDRIEVNYNLLNNAITPFDSATSTNGEAHDGWILFFQEMGIKFKLSDINNVFKYSKNGIDQAISANNTTIIQTDRNTLSVNGVSSTSIGNSLSAVSTVTNRGLSIIDPLFEYTSPNGWKIDALNNEISLVVSPDGCTTCESSKGFGDTGLNSPSLIKSRIKAFLPSNSGLYALNDLSILPKKFYLSFYEGAQTANINVLKNPPNVVLSIEDYNSIGTTTDLFGIRSALIAQAEDNTKFSYDRFEPNQHLFGIDMYRIRSCTTGGVAPSAHNFYMKRPPQLNYLAIEMYDDLLRPQVLPKYWSGSSVATPYESRKLLNPDTMSAAGGKIGYEVAAFNTLAYCKNGPIRSFNLNSSLQPLNFSIGGIQYEYGDKNGHPYFFDKAFPASFSFIMTNLTSSGGYFISRNPSVYPRDDAHMWVQKLYDAPIDNPMLEYFKRRYETYLNTYTKHQYSGGNARGVGHALIAQVDSYLESGKPDTLAGIEEMLDLILTKMQPTGATHQETSPGIGKQYAISFMEGYEMHSIINVLMAVDPSSVIYDKAYALLFGGGVYRTGLPGLVDASITTHFGYKDVLNCATNPLTLIANRLPGRCLASSSSTVTILDPLVAAAYILKDSDPARALQIISHVKKYLNGQFGSQPSGIPTNVASYQWNGSSTNRTALILNSMSDTSVTDWLKHVNHIEGLVR